MDLNQLRTFVTVAEFGHLTRAAEALHLSQPAVSGHIKALEEGFGVTLFERSSSGMALTPSGRRLLTESAQIMDAVERLKHSAQALRGEPTGKLRLGTVLVPSVLRVGDLMVLARDRYPQIELELVQVMSSDALVRVRAGTLDASFYFGAEPEADLTAVELRDIVYHVTCGLGGGSSARGRPSPGALIVAPEPTRTGGCDGAFRRARPSPERSSKRTTRQCQRLSNRVSVFPRPRDRHPIRRRWPQRDLAGNTGHDQALAVHLANRAADPLLSALVDGCGVWHGKTLNRVGGWREPRSARVDGAKPTRRGRGPRDSEGAAAVTRHIGVLQGAACAAPADDGHCGPAHSQPSAVSGPLRCRRVESAHGHGAPANPRRIHRPQASSASGRSIQRGI